MSSCIWRSYNVSVYLQWQETLASGANLEVRKSDTSDPGIENGEFLGSAINFWLCSVYDMFTVSLFTMVFFEISIPAYGTDSLNDLNQVELNSQSKPVSVETDGHQEGKQ